MFVQRILSRDERRREQQRARRSSRRRLPRLLRCGCWRVRQINGYGVFEAVAVPAGLSFSAASLIECECAGEMHSSEAVCKSYTAMFLAVFYSQLHSAMLSVLK